MKQPLRIVFIGWGAINRRVGALLAQSDEPIDIVGIAISNKSKPRDTAPEGSRFLNSPDELAELKPDLVVEAAGRAAIEQWAFATLAAAPEVVTSALNRNSGCDRYRAALADETACARTRRRNVVSWRTVRGYDTWRPESGWNSVWRDLR